VGARGRGRATVLAEDLLQLAGADKQTLALRRRPVDLDDLAFDEARRLRGDHRRDGAVLLEPDDDGPRDPHPPTGQDVAAKYGHKPSHVVALAMSDQPAAVGPSQEGVSHLTTCS
jgi:hypothetical protein